MQRRFGDESMRTIWLVLGLAWLMVGCDRGQSQTAATQPASEGKKISLQLNWKAEPQFGGFYAAKESGAFKKHGLDVEVVPGGVGTPTVQMVAAGKVPFAVVSADEVILSRANGADVVALMAVYQTCPQGLMTHAKRGLKSIEEIFRQPGTVAMQRGLPYASWLEKKYGFDKVKVVPSPGGDLSVFRSDPNYTMQCFVTSEPIAAKRAGLDPQTFLVAEAGYNPYTTVLVTRGEYLKREGDTVKRMVEACRELVRYSFETMKPQRIQARVIDGNAASIRVLEKLGFRFEGTLRSAILRRGRFEDVHFFASLQDEYG
jgi:NitT/TauT family transport system substrate-binding protein